MARGAEGSVDARFPFYFIFGERPEPDGRVDLSDANGDVAAFLRRQDAERLIKDRDEIRDCLICILEKFPDAYDVLWNVKEKANERARGQNDHAGRPRDDTGASGVP